MTSILSLNRARKAKAACDARQAAAENRVRFGRTKAQKALDAAAAERAQAQVAAHKRSPDRD